MAKQQEISQEKQKALTTTVKLQTSTHGQLIKANIVLEGLHGKKLTLDETVSLLCKNLNLETYVKPSII